jgi:hypothetical protein
MKTILSGWNVGFNKIGHTKLLRAELEYSLRKAKTVTYAVVSGQLATLELADDRIEYLTTKLKALGVKSVLAVDVKA